MNAPCARGKSYVFRQYMHSLINKHPGARILLLSANVLYGMNLTHELHKEGFDVVFYRHVRQGDNKGAAMQKHKVVVCSYESLHHLCGQHFDAILCDEARHISTLPGGATSNYNFQNLAVLHEFWERTPRRVVCDADLLYTVSDTEPCSAVQSLMAIIDPRLTVCATLTGPTPANT